MAPPEQPPPRRDEGWRELDTEFARHDRDRGGWAGCVSGCFPWTVALVAAALAAGWAAPQ